MSMALQEETENEVYAHFLLEPVQAQRATWKREDWKGASGGV